MSISEKKRSAAEFKNFILKIQKGHKCLYIFKQETRDGTELRKIITLTCIVEKRN